MISIVMTLRNESESIPNLLERINNSLDSYDEYEVFLITKKPERLKKFDNVDDDKVKIFKRNKDEGIASAVLRCIENTSYDTIIVMDSRMHHTPEKIPELISEIEKGNDVVVGTQNQENEKRYIKKFTVKVIDTLAKTLFRDIREVNNIKSGFFAFKKSVIQNANMNPIEYRILLEILILGEHEEISEVNIKSKSSNSKLIQIEQEASNYLKHVFGLTRRTGELLRIIKFSFVGGFAAVINLICLYLLTNFGQLHYLISGIIAIEIGLLSSFFMNKSLTFKDRQVGGIKNLFKALLRDHLVRSGGIIINMIILAALTKIGLYYIISQIVGIWFAGIWNFSGNKWWTWE